MKDGAIEALLAVDASTLTRDENFDRLLELDALASRISALTERSLVAVISPPTCTAKNRKNWDREEVACLLRWSFPYAASRLVQAETLVTKLPDTLALHETGAIGPAHTRALCEASYPLADAVTAKVEADVLGRAPFQTVTEFRRSINRAVHRHDPAGVEERHAEAKTERRVRSWPLPDGMAALNATHTALDIEAMMTRIHALANHIHPGDTRTADQRRADILRALILGTHTEPDTDTDTDEPDTDGYDNDGYSEADGIDGNRKTDENGAADPAANGYSVDVDDDRYDANDADSDSHNGNDDGDVVVDNTTVLPRQHGRHPSIAIVVPLAVALGHSDLPGELIGHGPIPASMCREAMADVTATFRRWIVSPIGELVDCSATYEPSQALTDLIIARDRTCRMNGCNRRACTCEIDHIVVFDGTNTIKENLEALCCRHHHGKHEADWGVQRLSDGTTVWTSPTGRVYSKPPDPYPDGPEQPPSEWGTHPPRTPDPDGTPDSTLPDKRTLDRSDPGDDPPF